MDRSTWGYLLLLLLVAGVTGAIVWNTYNSHHRKMARIRRAEQAAHEQRMSDRETRQDL